MRYHLASPVPPQTGSEMKALFHVLMDHFFTDEILAKSIAFGNRVVPIGKEVLNPKSCRLSKV